MNIEAVFFCNYSIGTDTWKEVPFVCGLYGKRILLIGGKKALRAGKERLVQAIAGTGMELVDTVVFGEDCTFLHHLNILQTFLHPHIYLSSLIHSLLCSFHFDFITNDVFSP